MNTKIVIAFYNKLLSLSLADALTDYPEYSAIHQVSDFGSLENVCKRDNINYLIADEYFADKFGIEKILNLAKVSGGKVIMLAEKKQLGFIKQMFAAGISAYVSPNSTLSEIVRAIKTLQTNKQFVSTDVLIDFVTREHLVFDGTNTDPDRNNLTRREKEVLALLGKETKPVKIATDLGMSIFTVNFHLKNLRRKLNSKNTTGLIRYSMQHARV